MRMWRGSSDYNDPTGPYAGRVVCTADLSGEDCDKASLGQGSTGNGNGGMFCDQALMPFITTATECSTYSSLIWNGFPSGVAQTIVPVLVGAGVGIAGSGC